jgi:hypothetical protein
MKNPWSVLPLKPPYVLPEDWEVLRPRHYTENTRPRLEILPAPFVGCPESAEVYLLSLNPGFKDYDLVALNQEDYQEQKRRSIVFASRFPFFILDPAFSGRPGYKWWNNKLKRLLEMFGSRRVAERLMCIQYFPYQSREYSRQELIPSQAFGFHLAGQAIDRGKTVVVMRGRRYWVEAVPELDAYPCIQIRNARNPTLSPKNMEAGDFDRIVAALS